MHPHFRALAREFKVVTRAANSKELGNFAELELDLKK